ncbi:MAG: hypothetical protein U5J62_03075 [Desulfurivibrio sp.]|nr:hypothetical protein [Desulfurivibrio sp.]
MDTLRLPAGRPFRLALLYGVLIFLLTVNFVCSRDLRLGPSLLMPLTALPLGALLGVLTAGGERLLAPLAGRLRTVLPGFTAGFLLFFICILGFSLVFSGLVSLPLSLLLIEQRVVEPTLAMEFRLYSFNFVPLVFLPSWLLAVYAGPLAAQPAAAESGGKTP